MEIQLSMNGRTRKEAANCIGGAIGAAAVYLGTPAFNFDIGGIILNRQGIMTIGEADEGLPKVLCALQAAGFYTPEFAEEEMASQPEAHEGLCIQMPLDGFTPDKIDILRKLVASKQSLLQKALGAEALPIAIGQETLDFAWFNVNATPEEIAAYTHLVKALCDMAKRQQRVLAVDKPVESEKYSFRCFLLRLGFIGEEYASTRKILLQNLSGNGSAKSVQQKPRPFPAEQEPANEPNSPNNGDEEQPGEEPERTSKKKRRFSISKLFGALKLMANSVIICGLSAMLFIKVPRTRALFCRWRRVSSNSAIRSVATRWRSR